MTISPEHAADLEQLKRALVAMRKLRARVDELEQAAHEPIAIVGIGCRLPGGVASPDAFWQLLRDGRDAIGNVPADRWRIEDYSSADTLEPAKIATRYGGFIDDVRRFDADFFGISPREAAAMDPQQRLILETAWEALEDAGIVPATLAGSATGVFVGIGLNDYGRLQAPAQAANPSLVELYSTTGNAFCIAANRLSYVLDLCGPSMAIDTACSSSLVALHNAFRSLRNGECSLALVAGANLMLSPENSISVSRFLAPDGRCKFGDASANGYTRGEGVITVVLATLRRCLAENLPIYALVRGSAINQDGHSSGLTVPNGIAQQAMLRAALADARVSAQEIAYVEAHGTGTTLGDPIEIQALGAVLRAERTLPIGSVKANIGHLEAAAGIAGLVKVALALKHGAIPPSLHYRHPNPHIPFAELNVRVATELMPWPETNGPVIAGVSSFGIGGANAHVILEAAAPSVQAGAAPPAPDAQESPFLLPLAAKSADTLRELAARYAELLQADPALSVADLCAAAARHRSHFAQRAAFVADDPSELRAQLADFAVGALPQGVVTGRASSAAAPKIAFLFTGQGAHYPGMGRRLYETEPVFRATVDRCADLAAPALGQDLRVALLDRDGAGDALLAQSAYAQPALFALECALADLWKSWGILPQAVLGHSLGQYAAATVAGVLSLEDGLQLVIARGRLMQALPAGGAMAAVFASPEQVEEALRPYDGRLAIAAHNGPMQVVVSGSEADVESLRAAVGASGLKTQRLATTLAFHSPLIEPVLEPFELAAQGIRFGPAQIPLISNLSGEVAGDEVTSPAYWRRHLREPVQFARSMQTLSRLGCNVFIESGPEPVLVAMGSRCLPDASALWTPSLRRSGDDRETIVKSLAALYLAGVDAAASALAGQRAATHVPLPTYPFGGERHWFSTPPLPPVRRVSLEISAGHHPLLGRRLHSPALTGAVYELELDGEVASLLDEHPVFGRPVLPMAAYVELMLAAGRDAHGGAVEIGELLVQRPLSPASAAHTAQVVIHEAGAGDGAADNADSRFEIISRAAVDEPWHTHAAGRLRPAAPSGQDGPVRNSELAVAQARCREEISVEALYSAFADLGMAYGPTFRGLVQLWRGEGALLGFARLPAEATPAPDDWNIHPALLDACLQVCGAMLMDSDDLLYLPLSIEGYRQFDMAGAALWSSLALLNGTPGDETITCRLELYGENGRLTAEAARIVFKRARRAALAQTDDVAELMYEVVWKVQPALAPPQHGAGAWLIVGDADGLAPALAANLEAAGALCNIAAPASLTEPAHARALLKTTDGAHFNGVVFLATDNGADPWASQESLFGAALHLTQALAASPTRLWLVTTGAQAVGDFQVAHPAQATLWGLGRVIVREHPELGCTLVDIDTADSATTVAQLAAELLGGSDEDQVALRGGVRLAPRLVHRPLRGATPQQLEIGARGSLQNLACGPAARPIPGPGEVVIRVHAAGLNFRDVLIALDMYPSAASAMGHECAGTVESLGAGVNGLSVGEPVLALAREAFGTFALARADFTLPKPAAISFAEAATIPIAFNTAAYGLRTLANLQAGEHVLIHAAAGGVGLAAVQIALHAGAIVIGTAGSSAKREFLKRMGVHNVFDSRSLSFVADVNAVTGGAGLDVVLNSLSGDFIGASFEVLRRGGRFLEIGKRGIWDQAQVDALDREIDYYIYDLGDEMVRDPALVCALFVKIMAEMASGTLRPLPLRVFPLESAAAAFDAMAHARHIGKLVIAPAQPPTLARADATYLITGGLGALGLLVARRLAQAGARHVALVGRHAPSPAAESAIGELDAMGVQVLVKQADVADEDALHALLDDLGREAPPLRGVVHAAGVLDDGPLAQQTWERSQAVLAPKVAGAWALHKLTAGLELDWVVFFSTGGALIGALGQANYTAANSFLDSLAQMRRAQGLPALSINWGVWGEAGMAATLDEGGRRRLGEQGLQPFSPAMGLAAFEAALAEDAAQRAVLSVRWERFAQQFAGRSTPSLLRDLVQQGAAQPAATTDAMGLSARLAQAAPGNRRTLLRGAVRDAAGRVLGFPPSRAVDPRQPLAELGLDSLMAVELRNGLSAAVERPLPTSLLFDYPTIEALTSFLETLLAEADQSAAPTAASAAHGADDDQAAHGTTNFTADLAGLSEAEAEALLLDELNRTSEGR